LNNKIALLPTDYSIKPVLNDNNKWIRKAYYNKGGEGIIGMKFYDNAGAIHYGWLRVNISTDLKSIKLINCAYSQNPNTSLKAGI